MRFASKSIGPASRRLAFVLLASCACVAGALAASSRPLCANVPRQPWLSFVEIAQNLEKQGLHLVRMRLNDQNCYAVRVQDQGGRQREGVLHPVTAEWVQF